MKGNKPTNIVTITHKQSEAERLTDVFDKFQGSNTIQLEAVGENIAAAIQLSQRLVGLKVAEYQRLTGDPATQNSYDSKVIIKLNLLKGGLGNLEKIQKGQKLRNERTSKPEHQQRREKKVYVEKKEQ